jgi:hypothetical protein
MGGMAVQDPGIHADVNAVVGGFITTVEVAPTVLRFTTGRGPSSAHLRERDDGLDRIRDEVLANLGLLLDSHFTSSLGPQAWRDPARKPALRPVSLLFAVALIVGIGAGERANGRLFREASVPA